MKKTLAMLTALMMTAAMAVPMSTAAEDRSSTIETSIAPTYTVTIPLSLEVAAKQEKNTFGAVELTAAQLAPDKCITVSLNASGKLKHNLDAKYTLAYKVYEDTVSAESPTVFTSATYLKAGDKTDLTVGITAADWNAAYAGTYKDTVTFQIAYTAIPTA